MTRLIRLIALVVGAVVLLVVLAAVAVSVFVDPNDYKGQIEAAVNKATGRKLVLDGKLGLHIFPTLSISLGHATLGNAPGFGNQPFAEIRSASLDLRLLPLLTKRIEIGEAELTGVVLNLERNAQGRDNWQDLGGGAPPAAAPAPGGGQAAEAQKGGAPVGLGVDVLRIADSEVKWSDASTGSKWTLSKFQLLASGFGPNVAFPVSTNFALSGKDLDLKVAADTMAQVSLADERYRLGNLHVKLDGSGASWPGGDGTANLSFASLVADLKAQTLTLDDLTAAFLGITAKGSLKGRNLLGDLALSGQVNIQQFDPSRVLNVFGAGVKTADPMALKRASARATFVYTGSRIGLDNMNLALDDSTLTGSVGLEKNVLRFDLAINEINADRYLPPAEQGQPKSDEGSLDAVDLPVAALKQVNAQGKLAFGKAQFAGLTLTDAAFSLAAAGGHIEIKPTAKLYGGKFAGDVKLDTDGDAVKLGYTQDLSGVDMAPLGKDLLDSEMISGTGSVTLNLTSRGSNVGQMRRALDGDVRFAIKNGALEGLDLAYELRRAHAVLNRSEAPPRPAGARRTPFSSVSASGIVKNAVLTTKDLNATLPFMAVDGTGTVNLLTNAIAFDLVAAFADSAAVKADPLLADLAGQKLPLKVGGSIEAPEVKPDFSAVAKARAKAAVQDKVDQQKSAEKQKLEQQKQEAQDKLRNKLRGLLNR